MVGSWLHEAVYRQRPELWPIFGSPIVTVFEVTDRSVSSSLWRKAEQQSLAVLHTTLLSTEDSATVAPFLYKLCSYSHYFGALLRTVQFSTIHTINAIIHSC